jgi:hypothetical protein
METIEIQREIVQFLLKRLKECALESAAFRAAMFNFSEEAKAKMMRTVEFYRQAAPIQQKVEKGFHDLDSLIQQVNEALDRESVHKLLESWNPQGPVN